MSEVQTYAADIGVLPTTIIQKAGVGGGNTWLRWEGGGGCSMRTVEKVRAYMAANLPQVTDIKAAS